MVQNNTGDPELTEAASTSLSEQLRANGVDPAQFELVARLDVADEGGLQLQILCSSREDHLLKAQVRITARGGKSRRQLQSLVAKAARDLAVDCR